MSQTTPRHDQDEAQTHPGQPSVLPQTPTRHAQVSDQTKHNGARTAIRATAIALGAVVVAPVLLSSQDLYSWAADPHGLGLTAVWPLLVPLALDFAAVAMIGMTIAAAFRRERPGVFEVLVWVFAGVSAYAQYRHGIAVRDAGGARDAWWAFPTLALLGPVLLHVTLSRIRTWARKDAGEQFHGAAGFGPRWLPGVAFRQTLRAWAASRREGISSAAGAISYVREVDAIAKLTDTDALHYAFGALGTFEPHAARVWLAARGTVVDQATIETVCAGRPASPVVSGSGQARVLPAAVSNPAPDSADSGSGPVAALSASGQTPSGPDHARCLAELGSKRARIRYAFSHLGRVDVPAALAWLEENGAAVSRAEAYAVAKQVEQDTPSGRPSGVSVLPDRRAG